MTSCRHVAASVLVLLTVGLGQVEEGAQAWMRLRQIDTVLRAVHASGSLTYQGYCGHTTPEAPPIQTLRDYSGQPTEVLQKMFIYIPHMRVTQDPTGLIRMVETDVPTDILDFRIQHLSFLRSGSGPNVALMAILMSPEVRAFRKARNIGPNPDAMLGPGDAYSGKPMVAGDLDDVTVSQALDYILQTFPGFWVYENCVNKEGARTVRFSFLERPSPRKEQP